MNILRLLAAAGLVLIPVTLLSIGRFEQYVASLHKDDMRHMTKEDIICSPTQLLVKPGNYLEPLSAALMLCPEFDPSVTWSVK